MGPSSSRLREWSIVIGWMAFVAALSLIPIGRPATTWSHADKLAHAALYGVLALVAARARARSRRESSWTGAWAFAIAVTFGASMEWLQMFVGRGPSTGDLAADALGAAAGAALWAIRKQSRSAAKASR